MQALWRRRSGRRAGDDRERTGRRSLRHDIRLVWRSQCRELDTSNLVKRVREPTTEMYAGDVSGRWPRQRWPATVRQLRCAESEVNSRPSARTAQLRLRFDIPSAEVA